MKKTIALFISLIALTFALPVAGATAEKVQVQPDKSIATAPPVTTRFILAAADTKAKAGKKATKAKAKKAKAKKEAKVKKTGTGFKLKPTAPIMA